MIYSGPKRNCSFFMKSWLVFFSFAESTHFLAKLLVTVRIGRTIKIGKSINFDLNRNKSRSCFLLERWCWYRFMTDFFFEAEDQDVPFYIKLNALNSIEKFPQRLGGSDYWYQLQNLREISIKVVFKKKVEIIPYGATDHSNEQNIVKQ